MFSWHKTDKEWKRRILHVRNIITRIYAVNPVEIERYFLRCLLNHVCGPTSFESLRTYNNRIHSTFRAAAIARGLFHDDSEWDQCLNEASNHCMPKQIRHIFSMILTHGNPVQTKTLFEKYQTCMSEDFVYSLSTHTQTYTAIDPIVLAHVALDISNSLADHSKTWEEYDLPEIDYSLLNTTSTNDSSIIQEERTYDHHVLETLAAQVNNLNVDQHHIFDKVVNAVTSSNDNKHSHLFFVDGPGGHGKTYLFNTIIGHLRLQKKIVLAVASSGIASLLLLGGRTIHNRFKIPLRLSDHSTCYISKQSSLATLLCQTSLIVWDEAPMSHRFALEAVDRTMRDIRKYDMLPLSGVHVLLGGDFRQILPVIPRANLSQLINACLKKSEL